MMKNKLFLQSYTYINIKFVNKYTNLKYIINSQHLYQHKMC